MSETTTADWKSEGTAQDRTRVKSQRGGGAGGGGLRGGEKAAIRKRLIENTEKWKKEQESKPKRLSSMLCSCPFSLCAALMGEGQRCPSAVSCQQSRPVVSDLIINKMVPRWAARHLKSIKAGCTGGYTSAHHSANTNTHGSQQQGKYRDTLNKEKVTLEREILMSDTDSGPDAL